MKHLGYSMQLMDAIISIEEVSSCLIRHFHMENLYIKLEKQTEELRTIYELVRLKEKELSEKLNGVSQKITKKQSCQTVQK